MTNSDFYQICKLLQREETSVSDRLVQIENTYRIFHRYDEFDFLELLTLKIEESYLREFEQKLLKLCDFLLKYNKE